MITEAVQDKLITGEELLEMGDIGPAELIDGRIVSISPTGKRHGSLEYLIARLLGEFVEQRGLGEVFVGEPGIYIRHNPDRIRAADVVFISNERAAQDESEGYFQVAPELVVEVISPSDGWEDINEKLEDYFSIGVERVWICQPKRKNMLVYRSPQEFIKFESNEILAGEGILNGFELPLSKLFKTTTKKG